MSSIVAFPDREPDPEARVEELEEKVVNLNRALQTRDTIGMAKGILMANQHLTADEAFDALRVASQHDTEQRKLKQIADEVVLTGDLPPDAGD
jgi:AmiR/NasT family two-component response regulator